MSTAAAAEPPRSQPLLHPDALLCGLPGIGPATARRLAAAGLAAVRDLVLCFPRRYRALLELAAPTEEAVGDFVRIEGVVHRVAMQWLPGRRSLCTVTFAAGDGTLFAARFFNQPWLKKNYPSGQRRFVEGQLRQKGRTYLLDSPRVLPQGALPAGEVQLRYPEVEGVSGARLVQWITHCLDRLDWSAPLLGPLPAALAAYGGDPRELLLAMHRPASVEVHEHARRSFAVREAVALFAAVERARRARAERPARVFAVDAALGERIRARIPLALTADQQQALEQLWQALAGPAAMGFLLQGDVGTGKTAVAVGTALAVLARGGTVAFLAPTELLAEQHHAVVAGWLLGSGVRTALLTATTKKAFQTALGDDPGPGPLFVFGTHALLSSDLPLPRLDLAIVDEQHRFGVAQRMALVHKGDNPHVLVMTATPIPRTLALSLFGDLDVVALRHKPAGHRTVRALHVRTEHWPRAVQSIARAIRRGGRVFVVCPAVGEDGEKGGAVRLAEVLGRQFRCGLVHGRQKAAARQELVRAFRAGAIDVLVGTTVLEVGVDVPEATLIVVVAAERFGIATLHQLRGRVGRGARRGLCLLCGPRTARVAAVCATTDGFELAEQDLAIRGSGELLGTAQSGFLDLRALDPAADLELLLAVRAAVRDGGGR